MPTSVKTVVLIFIQISLCKTNISDYWRILSCGFPIGSFINIQKTLKLVRFINLDRVALLRK
ncbi:hypothetical protein CXF72_12420 [Psychromonas sp. MB-3u-54]|nr:hypothetical protein CXF72_12420 [Psychromonas sp. MB-3u-54]